MVLNIRSTRMFMAHGFMRRIFEVFDRYQTSVDMVATSEVSVSLTIDQPERLDDDRQGSARVRRSFGGRESGYHLHCG